MTKERLYIFLLIYQKLIERLKLIFVNVIRWNKLSENFF